MTSLMTSAPNAEPAPAARSDAKTFLGVYEVTLEVADLAAAERFYAEIIGLPVITRWGPDRPAVWLGLGGGAFLGLWSEKAGGAGAIHSGRGGKHVHLALRVAPGSAARIVDRLTAAGYETERVDFDSGNLGWYVTDPDGNVIEFAEVVVNWDGTPGEAHA